VRKRLAAAVAALVVGASGMAAQTPEKIKLAIGYIPHVQFTPLYVGQDKGFYKAEGIELEISYGFGIDIFSLLQAGKIDLGLSDSDQLIIAGSKDLGLKAVYQYYQRYPVSVVAKAGRVSEPGDLAGKRIGTPELYGTSYIGLELFLKKFGLKGKAVVEKIGYTQETSLLGDKVDAVVCFSNNEPVLLAQRGVKIRQWDVRDFTDMVGASFISSSATISARRDALSRFARATGKAMAYVQSNPEEAFRIAMNKIGTIKKEDEPFFRKVLDATSTFFTHVKGFGYLDATKYDASIAELVSLGMIAAAYPSARILDSLVK
jgi:NitT/TauT family transport system substrate-binding protein